MALNNPDAGSRVRQPRAVITANGVRLERWESLEVVNNSHAVSDTWRVRLPLYGQPPTMDLAWWIQQATDVEVAIKVGFLQPDGSLGALTQLAVGTVDAVEEELMDGVLELRGRDYSGALIETIADELDTNQTSSQIAQAIVTNHQGTIIGQISPTAQKIGAYYNGQYTRLHIHENEWDLLTRLAQFEGYVVLMLGKTLYFGPRLEQDVANSYLLKVEMPAPLGPPRRSNMVSLRLTRALTFARDIVVKVNSSNHMTGVAVHAKAQAVNTVRTNRSGAKVPAQVYEFNDIPNLTQQQARQLANHLLQQFSQQERLADVEMPGDPLLNVQSVVQLVGTGAADQRYYVDRIEHEISVDRGYTMRVRLKNHDTNWQLQPNQG